MNIVFPMAGLNVSGGVKNLLLQAGELARAGHNVSLVVPDYACTPPFGLERRVNVRVIATGGSRLAYYAKLAHLAAEHADVCVVAFYPTVWCAVLSRLLRRTRTRIIYSVAAYEPVTHGVLAQSPAPTRLLRAGMAWSSYRLPAMRVYASRWLRDQVGDPRGVVIGRGIDLAVFSPAERSPNRVPRIGAIGRAGRVKGYQVLLDALNNLSVPHELVVVALDDVPGPGQRLPPLDERGMADFYNLCDVFAFTSLSEGFPAPPLEAMACGCAVVTTDCGGVREYAVADENCLMVPPGDASALHHALERVLTDADLRARLARAGIDTARAFDRQHMLECFLAIVGGG